MEDGSGVRTRTWTVRRPPLSPPAGVAPFAEVGFACFPTLRGGFAAGPANHNPGGRAPRNPHVRGLLWQGRLAEAEPGTPLRTLALSRRSAKGSVSKGPRRDIRAICHPKDRIGKR